MLHGLKAADRPTELDPFLGVFDSQLEAASGGADLLGGQQDRCGWLKDRYGVSWQLVPAVLPQLLGDEDPAKARRTMQALLKMGKLDIAALERAHAGDS